MSDFEQLLLVLGAIYLFECVWSVAPGTVMVTNGLSQHPTFRRFSNSTPHDRKGWHLVSILPFGMAYACQRWPIAISPQTVCSSSTALDAPTQHVHFDQIQSVVAMDREILINKRVFAKTASRALAEHLVRLLERLRTCDVNERASLIETALAESLDSQRVEARIQTTGVRLAQLRVACTVLFLLLFGIIPMASWWLPWPTSLWWLAPLFFLFLTFAVGLSCRGEYEWYGPRRAVLFGRAVIQTMAPTAAMRSSYLLTRDLLATSHPVAVTHVLCTRSVWIQVAQQILLEIHYPLGPNGRDVDETAQQAENWFNERLAACLTQCLRNAGSDADQLLAPPAQESCHATAYCPRCHAQYTDVSAKCAPCGDRTLIAF